jgi:predicted HAD superfamily phosphohydrolase YqeG
MPDYFYNIDASSLKDKTILIDIDGTLVADGEEAVGEKNAATINILSKHNALFLCSNKNLPLRNKALAEQLQVPFLDTPFNKPSKKILDSIDNRQLKNLVVIGDKYITDEIFAQRIGAPFIRIKRLISGKESLKTKMIYLVDDFIYSIACFFK